MDTRTAREKESQTCTMRQGERSDTETERYISVCVCGLIEQKKERRGERGAPGQEPIRQRHP